MPPGLYETLFNTDYPDYKILIDLQKRPTDRGSFSNVIAVACTALPIDFSKIDEVIGRETNNPECDLIIEINDTCIIFEFKVNGEDCSSQLKCQAEKIRSNESKGSTTIQYIDLSWQKIIKALQNTLSIQKQIGNENIFTLDFLKFLEKKFVQLFPVKRLSLIFPYKTEDEPNYFQLQSRLNQIKTQIFGGDKVKEIAGKHNRLVLDISEWRWANELHINSYIDKNDGKQYLTIEIYPADTKGQGWNFYKPGKPAINWPNELDGFQLETMPYLKFSHFNSGLFWYCPSSYEYKETHTREFFEKNSGRWYRNIWNEFELMMDNLSPTWRSKCEYDQKLTNSKRTYFDLSIGINLIVYIPYADAQKLDASDIDSPLANKLREIILKLRALIDARA
jgi:hypothetical protein